MTRTKLTQQQPVNTRRNFLKKGLKTGLKTGMGAAAASGILTAGLPTQVIARINDPTRDRKLSLHNLHTGENIETVYWSGGHYLKNEMLQISHLLRDHRENETLMMDTNLMNILWAVSELVNRDMTFNVISGYRTPKTNAMLRSRSEKVAKNSLHMTGKAIDIRGSNTELTRIKSAGLRLAFGGVGFYPKSNFVHLDSGTVRTW